MTSLFYFNIKYFKTEIRSMFTTKYLKEDIIAGLTVTCVAIPLSLAIAIASGVDAGIGLISAIIGGIIAAIFGGTRLAVTGPAAAMSILIANCIQSYGFTGLLVSGIITGILQLIFGLLQFGKFARLVPLAVISAFTAGIGFIIFIGQLPKALQLPTPSNNNVLYVIQHIGSYITTMNPMAFIFAIITLLILKILPRYFPKIPTPLIAVAIPTIIYAIFKVGHLELIGTIPHHLPVPKLPQFAQITDWIDLSGTAFQVFLLASLETLLSSSAVDSIGRGDLHNPDQELVGQGLANIGVAAFGGIPVTGVIARSSVNIAAGAKTRRAAIIHSLGILLVVYFAPKLIEMIPIATLAGVLLSTALSMMNISELIAFWKTDKTEVVVYVITFFSIIIFDLISGVGAGILVAFLIVAIRMLTTKTDIKLWTNKEVLRIALTGNMTFWSYDKLQKIQNYIATNAKLKFIIFEFDDLKGIDNTGASHLINIVNIIRGFGVKVIFHGLTTTQKHMFDSITLDNKPYIATITENEIKDILVSANVSHSANDLLKHGMEKFLGQFAKEKKSLLLNLAKGQNPHTLLITCADSRVNPNIFLSSGLGELFIIRNVGNVIPKFTTENYTYSEGAAIEFAISALNIRNIVVCGHTECGAIKASISNKPINSIALNSWIKIIKDGFKDNFPQNEYEGVQINLLNQIQHLSSYPIVKSLIDTASLTITAWIYDVRTANILEWHPDTNKFNIINTDSSTYSIT